MGRLLVSCLTLLVLCSSQAEAALVTANIDNFSTATGGTTTVFNSGGITVKRSVGGGTFFGAGYFLGSGGTMIVNFSANGGTFGDLYSNETGFAASEFTGFLLSASSAGNGTISMNGGPDMTISGGLNSYFFSAAPATSFVSFLITADSGAMSIGAGSGFQAVPEPSALLLVGSVLGMAAFRRRR